MSNSSKKGSAPKLDGHPSSDPDPTPDHGAVSEANGQVKADAPAEPDASAPKPAGHPSSDPDQTPDRRDAVVGANGQAEADVAAGPSAPDTHKPDGNPSLDPDQKPDHGAGVEANGQVEAGGGPGPIQAAGQAIRGGRRKGPPAPHAEPAIGAGANPAERNAAETPRIHPEATEIIRVGAGGKLTVPRENPDDGIDEGVEIDLFSGQPKKIGKPDRRQWVVLSRASELITRLLLHKPKADAIEVEHYYVEPELRAPILDELKIVRVFVFYSLKSKTHGIWIVNVTPENTWYESLHQLFTHPPDFFAQKAIRVMSDKPNSRYRVRVKPLEVDVKWPQQPTEDLLGEALGPDRFIKSPDHPVYRDLIEGEELAG